MKQRPARHPPGHELNPDPPIKELPNSGTVEVLGAEQDNLIRHHVGILRPDQLPRAAYLEALEKARRREHPSPPPRRRRRITRRQLRRAEKSLHAIQEFEDEVAVQLFVAGALLEIAGDEGVDRELLAREIVRGVRERVRRRIARRKAKGLKG